MNQNPKNLRADETHHYLHPSNECGGSGVNFQPIISHSDQLFAKNACSSESTPQKRPKFSNRVTNSRTTKICLQFQRGHCYYGQNCQFAHVVKNRNEEDHGVRIVCGSRPCWRFLSEQGCHYGQRCRFLHGVPEGFKKRFASDAVNNGAAVGGNGYGKIDWKKTKLCERWEKTGSCEFGLDCNFAHGRAELQMFSSQNERRGSISGSRMVSTAAATCGSHRITANLSDYELQLGNKFVSKWKESKKLNGIYADWIDEMPFVYSSLGKVEVEVEFES